MLEKDAPPPPCTDPDLLEDAIEALGELHSLQYAIEHNELTAIQRARMRELLNAILFFRDDH
jgi:hypothetical protein